MAHTKRILLIRNDKLGDFMLAYPSFALLKLALPDAHIMALVPAYTAPMAAACPWIDEVIIDTPNKYRWVDVWNLTRNLRYHRIDAVICLFSTTRVALAAFLAGISYRLAPATKIAQLFYNHRLRQRRSRSEKPEYEYNADLVRRYLHDQDISIPNLPGAPLLHFSDDHIQNLRTSLANKFSVPVNAHFIFVHPGSGGSARNLSLEQYASLLNMLRLSTADLVVISCGPGEVSAASQLSTLLGQIPHRIFSSQAGLLDFSQHLALADLFISGSTGPLHIAGALDRPTVAFYPRRRSATSLRWQTLNSPSNRLSFMPPEDAADEDMSSIDLALVAQRINEKFLLNR